MELIEPSAAYIRSYQLALTEFEQHGIFGFWKNFGPIDDDVAYVDSIKNYQHRSGQETGFVVASTFWLVEGCEFIGHTSVRHTLDESLKQTGGHIGYSIRPTRHGQGYGTQILRLVLPRVKAMGISAALLTCDKDNVASRRIIEKNGGILSGETEKNGKPVLQFWIQLR